MLRPDPIPPLKQQLASLLVERLDGWSGEMAGSLMGVDQPRMSNLRNAQLDRFSLERLIRFVERIGGDVTIQVAWTRKRFIGRKDSGTLWGAE